MKFPSNLTWNYFGIHKVKLKLDYRMKEGYYSIHIQAHPIQIKDKEWTFKNLAVRTMKVFKQNYDPLTDFLEWNLESATFLRRQTTCKQKDMTNLAEMKFVTLWAHLPHNLQSSLQWRTSFLCKALSLISAKRKKLKRAKN